MASNDLPTLLSTTKSTSGLKVALHPLVILTISDYITRHTLRGYTWPLIGALLGQHIGGRVEIEQAFEVKTTNGEVDMSWFAERVENMKLVHKESPLDFIGIYTLVSSTGPTSYHSTLFSSFQSSSSDKQLLLGFHPQNAMSHSSSGSLPVSVYEACSDSTHLTTTSGDKGADVEMTDAEAPTGAQAQSSAGSPHFHTLSYTIDSSEAERIAVAHVAAGSAPATAISLNSTETALAEVVGKGKKRDGDKESKEANSQANECEKKEKEVDIEDVLSEADKEMITSLTAKANAVRMLQSRVRLIKAYLEEYESQSSPSDTRSPEILRAISALLARLPLLVPSSTNWAKGGITDINIFEKELAEQENDVKLVELLGGMTESVKGTREVGRKFATLLNERGKEGELGGVASFGGDEGMGDLASLGGGMEGYAGAGSIAEMVQMTGRARGAGRY